MGADSDGLTHTSGTATRADYNTASSGLRRAMTGHSRTLTDHASRAGTGRTAFIAIPTINVLVWADTALHVKGAATGAPFAATYGLSGHIMAALKRWWRWVPCCWLNCSPSACIHNNIGSECGCGERHGGAPEQSLASSRRTRI
jgi:hypothetical protein